MRLYRVADDGSLTLVGSSTGTQLETNYEQIDVPTPLDPGKYAIYVDNYAAPDPTWTGMGPVGASRRETGPKNVIARS